MSLDIGVDPQTTTLLTALGITDGDGQLVGGWFDDPLAAIRSVLSNPTQRAALFQLLDDLLPADPSQPGWHPLLDTEVGNLYLTVEDDIVGIAASMHSDDLGSGVGQVRGSVRLPLVDTRGDLDVIAGTAAGPVLVGIDVGFTGADIPMTGVGAAISVAIDDTAPLGVDAAVQVAVRGFDLGGGDSVDLLLDSGSIGADLVKTLRLLLQEVVDLLTAEAAGNAQLARLAEHFFDLLGIGTTGPGAIPPLPIEDLFSRPESLADWLVDIVDTPTTLTAWASHLTGLLGDDLGVSGSGAPGDPFRARLLDSDVVDLFVLLEATDNRELEIGVEVRVETGAVALSAVVTVLRIPLPALPGQPTDPGAPARFTTIVPSATVGLVAPNTGRLVDDAPDVQIGTINAGFRLTGGSVQPWLAITGVVLNGDDHGTVDLTDADAVIGVASDAALGALEDAIGDSPVARALLTLAGLRKPETDPTSPHLIDPAALGRGPTVAIGSLHREVLADAAHPWSHMLTNVALLAGLTPAVTGGGTAGNPWVTPIDDAGPVALSLAAWNASTATDPAGLQRLRLGLLVSATEGVFDGRLLVDLLAIDLPATGPGNVTLVGRTQVDVGVTPSGPLQLDPLAISSGRAGAFAGWRPGEPPTAGIGVRDVRITFDGDVYGPYDWALPGLPPDLGLGADAVRLLGQLLSSAVRTWGGEAAYLTTALVGLHRDLPDIDPALRVDWPRLADRLTGADPLTQLLDDPVAVLRAHLHELFTGVTADGVALPTIALQQLGRLLPDDSSFAGGGPGGPGGPGGLDLGLGTIRPLPGAGRYDDPWIIPIVDESADPAEGVTRVDGLVWLDPAGPPASWIAALAQLADGVGDGSRLAGFLSEVRAFRPTLAGLLDGRDLDTLGAGIDELTTWLTDGDGLVPLVSQLPDGWTHGTVVSTPHGNLPRDPAVISQLTTWLAATSGPVLLVAPPFADHTIFDDLVRTLTNAAPAAGRHFDLRALPNPNDVDLAQITAVAAVYTADLLADSTVAEVDQLRAVVQRIQALTGQRVRLVGHSTAGVVARTLAAAQPALVASIATLGSPHAGSDLRPLTDTLLAEAVRVVASVAGPLADSALGATVTQLAALLDGAGGDLGGAIRPSWFAGAAAGIVDTVPRLAIGAQLVGDLVGTLAGAVVTGLEAGDDAPTHLGVGLRLGLSTPAASDGEIAFDAAARLDLTRLQLVAGAVPPPRPATALSVETQLFRPGGWLVGDGLLGDAPISARVRRVEAGVTIVPAAGTTGLGVQPWLRLHEASVSATPVRDAISLGDTALRDALDAVLAELLAARAAANAAAGAALDLLTAAGAVIDTSDGPRASIGGLTDLATVPIRVFTERRAALLDALADALGQAAGTLSIGLPELPLRLSLDDTARIVRLATTAPIVLADGFTIAGQLDLDTRTLAATIDVALAAGPFELRRAADGAVTVRAEPWLAPLTLRPFDPAALRARLGDLIPDLAISAVSSAVLGELAGTGISIPPISALLRDPAGWLRGPDALGSATGFWDGDKIDRLLRTAARGLSLDDASGLGLPGGFAIAASGSDPLRIELTGAVGDVADANAVVELALALRSTGPQPTDVEVTPSGSIALAVPLPGDWGQLTITFAVEPSGVRLVVQPGGAGAIQLLPTVSGLGDVLASTATALVPKVLQEITDALAVNTPHPVLDVALDVAEALAIYDPTTGFTGTVEAARIRQMLDPGWLESQVTDPAAIIAIIQRLFPSAAGAGVLPLPAGHRVLRVEDRLRWEMDLLPGCVLGAELGWATAGHPQVRVTLTGLGTGPVTIVEARLGYLDAIEGLLRVRVEVGDPMAWFTPELEVTAAGERIGLRLLPFGPDEAADAEIVLLPTPGVTLTPEGGLLIAGQWLLPLLTRFVIPQVDQLLQQDLWAGGPSSRRILHGAGLVTTDSGPLQLPTSFPEPAAIGMGALKSALGGLSVQITDDLDLSFAEDNGRFGIRLHGDVTITGDDVAVTVLFGRHDWLGEDAGVTAWVIGPSTDPQLPVAPAPGLEIVGLGLQVAGPDEDTPLFGDGDSAVQLGGIGAMLFANFEFWDATTKRATFAVDSLGGAVELIDTAIRVDGGDGDSFVAKLIPQELGAGFTTAIAYRNDRLEVHGGPGDLDNGIELTFPLNLNIFDVIFLRELYLAAMFGQQTDVVAALSGNAELGPIAVTVTRVGLRVTITGSGATLSFKPPDGFGFSLDASTIRLGGFLLVDEARGRYVGALEIAVLEKFALTAIGIVTTKKPDGSPGFSLLMLVTLTLPVPIPLGYGFFFSGAGGLLGLNRGMDVDRIRTGLRTGTADSILFPTDIINRIDVIVRDLEEAFPPAEGHFLIAPMGMIQWMNPALVTLKVGIILEIAPQPNIALLGVLRLALPTPDAAVVDMKVAFLGGVDIGASLLYFDASIYDSYIGYADFKLSLEGDIAIRLCWGAKPDLVITVGGFHPSYTPASHLKLPSMRRLSLSLLKDNPRLTLSMYFAVTSNTIQFGAQLEFFVGVDGFSISGDFGFDVLVQFVPFLIDAHMWGRLAVTAGGCDICSVNLDLQLRGPTPWYARGTASFKVLFIKVSIDVEATFGVAQETTIPAEPVLPKLLDAFRDPLNWAAELSASATEGITLRPLPTGTLVVDACGLLSVRQNLIPLATDIGLVGKTPPSDVQRVTVTNLSFGTEVVEYADVTAPFSPSTFAGTASNDADLLKAPAFEDRPNGAQATAGDTLQAGFALHHQQRYELIVIDDPDPDAPTPPAVSATPALDFSALHAGGAIGASVAAQRQLRLAERGTTRAATTAPARFAVTTKDSLATLGANGQPTAGVALLSRTDAEQLLNALPADGRRFQIVPEVHVG